MYVQVNHYKKKRNVSYYGLAGDMAEDMYVVYVRHVLVLHVYALVQVCILGIWFVGGQLITNYESCVRHSGVVGVYAKGRLVCWGKGVECVDGSVRTRLYVKACLLVLFYLTEGNIQVYIRK